MFLPGQAEIRRTETLLKDLIGDPAVDIVTLYGAIDAQTQDRAISPAPAGRRKVVLATSIAETSLTIEGVRIVIDSGLARVPRYEPDMGLTRLETVRVSRAAADQRRGRAGRTEPGVCYRLWDEPQTASLEAYARPEMLSADLSGMLLDLAQWGAADPGQLAFLDPPPSGALTEARALLSELGAIDAERRITDEGRKLRRLPLPPRLARMVVDAAARGRGQRAADIAAILSERGLGGDDVDLGHRLEQFRRDRSRRSEDARRMAKRWADDAAGGRRRAGPRPFAQVGAMLSLAYPDRIAKSRGGNGAFLMANGRGAKMEPASALAREPFLAVAEIAGSAAQSRILLAAPITLAEIEQRFADQIERREEISFDAATAACAAAAATPRRGDAGRAAAAGPARRETPRKAGARASPRWASTGCLDEAAEQWRDRVMFLRPRRGRRLPDLSDEALAATRRRTGLRAPLLEGRTLATVTADDLETRARRAAALGSCPAARCRVRRRISRRRPATRHAIDYEAEGGPVLAIRVQELFGLDRPPSFAGGRVPLVLHLLSPAHRPIQITRDLPGFWRGSWAAVKAEMSGRYPRHPWPDDPAAAHRPPGEAARHLTAKIRAIRSTAPSPSAGERRCPDLALQTVLSNPMMEWSRKTTDSERCGNCSMLCLSDGCGRPWHHALHGSGRNPAAAMPWRWLRDPRPPPAGVVRLSHRDLEQRRPRHFQIEVRVDGRFDRYHGGYRSVVDRAPRKRRRQARHPSVGTRLQHQNANRQRRRQGRPGAHSTASRSAASRFAMSRRWWWPTRRCRQICSA